MGKTKPPKGKGAKRPKGKNGRPQAVDPEPGFDILTLEEAAALLRVSAEALRVDVERGSVPARLIGGEWRFARPTLWSWVTSTPVSPPPRQKLVDLPVPDITPEEQEAFRAVLAANRDEVDRVTKSGKYAEDE
jgi:hypothetical protein